MKNTWIYIAVAVALVLLGVWFYIGWKKRNGNSEDTETDKGAIENPSKPPSRGSFACKRNLTTANAQTILQYGDCGEPVKSLQQYLNSMLPAASKLVVDGKFGSATESALLKSIGSAKIAYAEFNPVTKY